MNTRDDNVELLYNGNKMHVKYIDNEDQTVSFLFVDENNQQISATYEEASSSFAITDERFVGISLGIDYSIEGSFYIQAENQKWLFTNQYEDGTYYHINRMGKLDKMVTAPSAVFTKYEGFATNRGYIWSRTIPLLKDYVFLGSGPDTFTTVYPQQDYINFERYGYGNGIITKPHNLYLQIATQTGILSLIAFLVFYGMYFVTSLRLYIKGRFSTYYAQVGLAIFIGTIAYMVTGLTNDSSITTAPIFWVLIGTGIAVNYKVKPMILEEVTEEKKKKAEVVNIATQSKV
jgi:hypothetical protein